MSSPDRPAVTPSSAATPASAPGVAELFGLLVGTRSVEDFLSELTQLAARTLDVSCGLTLRRDARPLTVVSSDALASAVDEVQYGLGHGPCLQALETGEIVSVPDLLSERRWDSYPGHALARGVRSSLSLPMSAGQQTGGAMNLYATTVDAFAAADVVARATAFAAQGAAVLTVALHQAEQAVLTGQLREALTSRSTIDQAIGIVMGQQRCDATTAFGILRAASQGRNRKLREIAAEIVVAVGGTPAPDARELDQD